jgi:hypothetical protein
LQLEIEAETIKNGCLRVASQSANGRAVEACHRARSLSVRLRLELVDNLLQLLWRLARHELRQNRFQLATVFVFAIAASVQPDCGVVFFNLSDGVGVSLEPGCNDERRVRPGCGGNDIA